MRDIVYWAGEDVERLVHTTINEPVEDFVEYYIDGGSLDRCVNFH